jgi:hypothetical protein
MLTGAYRANYLQPLDNFSLLATESPGLPCFECKQAGPFLAAGPRLRSGPKTACFRKALARGPSPLSIVFPPSDFSRNCRQLYRKVTKSVSMPKRAIIPAPHKIIFPEIAGTYHPFSGNGKTGARATIV